MLGQVTGHSWKPCLAACMGLHYGLARGREFSIYFSKLPVNDVFRGVLKTMQHLLLFFVKFLDFFQLLEIPLSVGEKLLPATLIAYCNCWATFALLLPRIQRHRCSSRTFGDFWSVVAILASSPETGNPWTRRPQAACSP